MLNIEYVTGIKLSQEEKDFTPIELYDDFALLSLQTYTDTLYKLTRTYFAIKEQDSNMPNMDINEVINMPDFWFVLGPTIERIAANFNIQLVGLDNKAKFIELIKRVNEMGNIVLDLNTFNVLRLADECSVATGIKITDDSGGTVYSFASRDKDDFGRVRDKRG